MSDGRADKAHHVTHALRVKPRAVSERAIREEQAQPPQFRVALPSVTATGKGMAWAGWANADRPMPPSKYGG